MLQLSKLLKKSQQAWESSQYVYYLTQIVNKVYMHAGIIVYNIFVFLQKMF